MQKRFFSLHSDVDLRNSVEDIESKLNKLAFFAFISYLNGLSSDKGWILWKSATIQKVCFLNKMGAKRFMEAEDVICKLIFGKDKNGNIWASHRRTQKDLQEYFKGKFEQKELEIIDEKVTEKSQESNKVVTEWSQNGNGMVTNSIHKPLKNNDSENTKEIKEIKEKKYIESECVDINIVEEKKIEQKVRRSTHAIPIFEEVLEYTNFHAFKFSKLDVKKWHEHWELLGWIDKNGNSFDWKQKIAWALNDKTFLIQAESQNGKPKFNATEVMRAQALKIQNLRLMEA